MRASRMVSLNTNVKGRMDDMTVPNRDHLNENNRKAETLKKATKENEY
jgi:hypothetical protein